jgi:hypothetical protein
MMSGLSQAMQMLKEPSHREGLLLKAGKNLDGFK